jgi:hypothetical protein
MIPRDPDSPLTAVRQIFFGFIVMPTFVVLAWYKAPQFDPYTMSFFTKTFIEPTLDMPGEIRIIGWVMIGIGAWLVYAGGKSIIKRIGSLRERLLVLWIGCLIAAFGGAFFVAANAAQDRIIQEQGQ